MRKTVTTTRLCVCPSCPRSQKFENLFSRGLLGPPNVHVTYQGTNKNQVKKYLIYITSCRI